MLRRFAAALAGLMIVSAPANAAQMCAWLVETSQPGHVHSLDLWLQSDSAISFVYILGGRGIVQATGESNSLDRGTYSLVPNTPRKIWTYATTFYAPGKIDVTLDIHKTRNDLYTTAEEPLLANFVFKRDVPDGEQKPSADLAQKQCMEIMNGGLPY